MSQRKKFEDEILAVLPSLLDTPLQAEGFEREKGSRHYRRTTMEGQQTILIHYETQPRDDSSKAFLIRPKIQVSLPRLSKLASQMTQGNPRILPAPEMIIAVPLYPDLKPEIRIGHFANTLDERKNATILACHDVISKGLPFASLFQTAHDLISAYERNDKRLKINNRMLIFITAAYLYTDHPKAAQKIVQQYFDKSAVASLYQSVITYTAQNQP